MPCLTSGRQLIQHKLPYYVCDTQPSLLKLDMVCQFDHDTFTVIITVVVTVAVTVMVTVTVTVAATVAAAVNATIAALFTVTVNDVGQGLWESWDA